MGFLSTSEGVAEDNGIHVCLTFDDGYDDNYSIVAPTLEEYGVRGTFFIASGVSGTDRLYWFDRAAVLWVREAAGIAMELGTPAGDFDAYMAALKKLSPDIRAQIMERVRDTDITAGDRKMYRTMGVAEVVDLHRRGHEIGAHSVSHPLLPQLGLEELNEEIADSREQLREWIGGDVCGFCYPNGDYDERVLAAVDRAGYSYACTVRRGINRSGAQKTTLRRVDMNPARVTRNQRNDMSAFRSVLCEAAVAGAPQS